MPTENRSSNTEQMVSVPMSTLEKCLRDARLVRFTCDKHVLHLQDLLTQPAAQHQGEPVGEVVAFGEGLHEVAWAKGKMPSLGAKLYTHPDAGEVERLHNGHVKSLEALNQQSEKQRDHWIDECKTLRAQLAERDALLRRCLLAVREQHCDEGEADFDLPAPLLSDIDAALSARADPKSCGACANGCISGCQLEKDSPPSSPFERDELVPASLMLRQAGFGNLADAVDEARAALERKP